MMLLLKGQYVCVYQAWVQLNLYLYLIAIKYKI